MKCTAGVLLIHIMRRSLFPRKAEGLLQYLTILGANIRRRWLCRVGESSQQSMLQPQSETPHNVYV